MVPGQCEQSICRRWLSWSQLRIVSCPSVPFEVFSIIGSSSRTSMHRRGYHLSTRLLGTPHFYFPSDPLLPYWMIRCVPTIHYWRECARPHPGPRTRDKWQSMMGRRPEYATPDIFLRHILRDCSHGSGSENLLFHKSNC